MILPKYSMNENEREIPCNINRWVHKKNIERSMQNFIVEEVYLYVIHIIKYLMRTTVQLLINVKNVEFVINTNHMIQSWNNEVNL